MPVISFGDAVVRLARDRPGAVAVRSGGDAITRAGLESTTARIAARWVVDGLAVDDVVAVALPPGIDFVVACVAAWRAGATVLPLRVEDAAERAALLETARPALLVDEPVEVPVELPAELPAAGPTAGPTAGPPDRVASSWKLTPSSGSTGRPKLIRASAPARLDPDAPVADFVPRHAVQLVAAPIAHAASFVYAMRGLLTGHELVVMPRFDPGEWLRLVAAYGVTWAPLNPQLMRAILRHPDRPTADVSSLESVLHLGARCPPDLKRSWLDWLGPDRVVEVYAGSESQGVACIGGREWLAHPGSVGRGVGGTEFRVVRIGGDRTAGSSGTWCAPDEVGEIVMRRPGTAYSYLGADPVVRTIEGEPGWHTLGDAGRLDADGYLYVGDRLADLIETPGGPVQPADVEAVLDAHPAVGSSAVVARESGLHAVVEGEAAQLDPVDLAGWVADRLPAHQRPVTWDVTTDPVRDDAGKVRRAAYR